MLTTKNIGDVAKDNGEGIYLYNSAIESRTYLSSSSLICILKETSPNLNNISLYSCEICKLGYDYISRKIFPEEEFFTTSTTRYGQHPCEPFQQLTRELCADPSNNGCHPLCIPDASTSNIGQVVLSKQHPPIQDTRIKLNLSSFKCDECRRLFSSKPNLSQHNISVHGAEAGFSCSVCGKGFVSKSVLSRHLLCHETNIEMKNFFKCDICQISFTGKRSLTQHNISVHEAKAKFTCSVCQRGFAFKCTLKNHLLTHETYIELKSPFKCDICQKRFLYHHILRQHNISVHGEKAEFTCSVCQRGFATKYLLKHHYSLIHETNVES